MRIHERPTPAMAEHDAFLRELGEGACDRRPADAVAAAELVLGGRRPSPSYRPPRMSSSSNVFNWK